LGCTKEGLAGSACSSSPLLQEQNNAKVKKIFLAVLERSDRRIGHVLKGEAGSRAEPAAAGAKQP
jgi:hypothetical protein